MKKGIAVFLALVLVGGAGGGGYYYWNYVRPKNGNGERVSSDSENAVYVDSVSVLAGLGSGNGLIQRFGGVIEPQQTWEAKLENERTVEECFVKEGDEVKEGQKLFTYDTRDDEDKLATAEIELERYENSIQGSKNTIAQLERDRSSATTSDEQLSITTQIRVEENSIKQNEYEYKVKEMEIEQLKEAIKDSAVTSEIAGVIKSINDPNSNSSAMSMSDSSEQAYITVVAMGDYRVKGTVNEQNRQMVTEGMEMIVHSRVDESITWRGTLTEIDLEGGQSNESSGYYGYSSDGMSSSTNYPFYVELESSEGLILGQHVYMEPDLGQEEQKDGIWLDDYYIVTGEDGSSYVWAASGANLLEKRAVTLGEYDEDLMKYEILEGLDEDDYITVPDDTYTEGLPVVYNEFSSGDLLTSYSYDDSGYEDAGYEDLDGGEFEDLDFEGDIEDTDYDEMSWEDVGESEYYEDFDSSDDMAIMGDMEEFDEIYEEE